MQALRLDGKAASGGDRDAKHRRATIISAMAPPSLRDVGEDPDPRFTFANERTLLAWNRSAMPFSCCHLAVDTSSRRSQQRPKLTPPGFSSHFR